MREFDYTSEGHVTGIKNNKKLIIFFTFLFCGLTVFLIGMTFSPLFAYPMRLVSKILVAVTFLMITFFLYKTVRFYKYWRVCFSFFIAAAAILCVSVLGDRAIQLFHLNMKTAHGIAWAKCLESVIIVVAILLFKVQGRDFASVYLQKGNLKKGLLIGVSIFACFSILAVFKMTGQAIALEKVVPLIPWILIFVLANGTMEELLFRGLFLKKFQPFLGAKLSNILTAIIFAIAHMQVKYTSDVPIFVIIVFILGLGLGHSMQKTDSLIAPALFHAGADMCFIIDIFINSGVTI